jgi:Arc-like DNA binding dprotein
MPRKRKVGRPPGRAKPHLLSVRISRHMRDLLAQAAWENRRSVSREVEARLDRSFGRYRRGDRELPPHLSPLVDAFAFTARYLERRFGCRWFENRLAGRELASAIGHVMTEFSPDADDVIPPKIIENAKRHGPGEKVYLTHPGIAEAEAIVMLLRVEPGPLKDMPYSEWQHELWKIRRDLEHLERRRKR